MVEFGIITAPRDVKLPVQVYDMPDVQNTDGELTVSELWPADFGFTADLECSRRPTMTATTTPTLCRRTSPTHLTMMTRETTFLLTMTRTFGHGKMESLGLWLIWTWLRRTLRIEELFRRHGPVYIMTWHGASQDHQICCRMASIAYIEIGGRQATLEALWTPEEEENHRLRRSDRIYSRGVAWCQA